MFMDNKVQQGTPIIIPLRKPFSFEGKEYTEIKLDVEALTGKDMIDAETEARAMGVRSIMLESSKAYQAILAARAAGVTVDLINALSAKEFSRVTGEVQSFLLE
jgi:phage FluMu protein gp41